MYVKCFLENIIIIGVLKTIEISCYTYVPTNVAVKLHETKCFKKVAGMQILFSYTELLDLQ